MEQLLALGTVVKVQVEERSAVRLVVAGYYPCDGTTGKVYDYSAVMYPWGMQPNPAIQMFNRNQILSVEAQGYLDEEGEDLTRRFPQAMEEYRKELEQLVKGQKTASGQESGESAKEASGGVLEEFG